jgi:hypothetical protein
MQVFEFQRRICWNIWNLWNRNERHGCVVRVDTGLGKTLSVLHTLNNMYRHIELLDGTMMDMMCGPTVVSYQFNFSVIVDKNERDRIFLPILSVLRQVVTRELGSEEANATTAMIHHHGGQRYSAVLVDLRSDQTLHQQQLRDTDIGSIDTILALLESTIDPGEIHLYENDDGPEEYMNDSTVFRSLLLIPISVVQQWYHEMDRMGVDESLIYMYHGTNRSVPESARFVITTVETLVSDFSTQRMRNDTPLGMEWSVVVIDEVHKRGNTVSSSTTTPKYERMFDALTREFTIALTATPYGRGVENIESIIKLIGDPTSTDIPEHFLPTERNQLLRVWKFFTIDYDAYRVHAFPDTRESTIFSLPSLTYDVRYQQVPTHGPYVQVIRTQSDKMGKLLSTYKMHTMNGNIHAANGVKIRMDSLRLLMRMYAATWQQGVLDRNTVNGVSLPLHKRTYDVNLVSTHPKYMYVMEYIKEHVARHHNGESSYNHHLVITSEFLDTLGMLRDLILQTIPGSFVHENGSYVESKVHVYTYTGSDSRSHRTLKQQLFNENSNPSILLLGKGAGREGINLFSGGMVVFEPGMKFADDLQVIGRVRRLGQSHHVRIMQLVMQETIEQRMRIKQWGQVVEMDVYMPSVMSNYANSMFADTEKVFVKRKPQPRHHSTNLSTNFSLYAPSGGLGEPSAKRTKTLMDGRSNEQDEEYVPYRISKSDAKCYFCGTFNYPHRREVGRTPLCQTCETVYNGSTQRRRLALCPDVNCYSIVTKERCMGCDRFLDSWTCVDCMYKGNVWGDEVCRKCNMLRSKKSYRIRRGYNIHKRIP